MRKADEVKGSVAEPLGSASVGSALFSPRAAALPSPAARISRGWYCIGSRLLWSGESLVSGGFPESEGEVKA